MNHDGSDDTAGVGAGRGLSLAPFRATRPQGDPERIASLLCPPYDVIDAAQKAELLHRDPDNAVAMILPEPNPEGYRRAAGELDRLLRDGVYAVDESPSLYVYEMSDGQHVTRGLVGAVELRDPADGVILPHENTMAGPVADRLELMTATDSDLEPIYLVYDGGGAASAVVRDVDVEVGDPLVDTTTPDGIEHRLWAVTDPGAHATIADDLAGRRALIADGHHRYATYRERQRRQRSSDGSGPWDRGMALLVDSSDYGPQVHAIHRVVPGLSLADAVEGAERLAATEPVDTGAALERAEREPGFAVVLTNGRRSMLVTDPDGALRSAAHREGDVPALSELDVTVVHRGLVESAWHLVDDVDTVRYAHTAHEAIAVARESGGVAVLLRPTPVAAVSAVAAAGARMPRKSTLFTPKPASGLLIRRLLDQLG